MIMGMGIEYRKDFEKLIPERREYFYDLCLKNEYYLTSNNA